MSDKMEVDMDPFTALGVKRSLMSPHLFQPIEKSPKLDPQLATNHEISRIADSHLWKNRINNLACEDSDWREFFSDIIVTITSRNLPAILPPQSFLQAAAVANSLGENELHEWKDAVRKGLEDGDWTILITHPKLRAETVSPSTSGNSQASAGGYPRPLSDQETATQNSWLHPFRGDAAKALWEHIDVHFQALGSDTYAHYAAIVQSSGMGKSRTVDEMGKDHFVIPMNIRGTGYTGYPPPDDDVRNYLAGASSRDDAYNHSCAFLEALFTHTNTLLQSFDSRSYKEMLTKFQVFMNEGQKMAGHNDNRKQFFSEVIQKAKELERKISLMGNRHNPSYNSPNSEGSSQYPPCKALAALVEFINSVASKHKGKNKAKIQPNPIVTLCFDEAHTIATRNGTGFGEWSVFNELRHALRTLHHLPMFTLFLSTTGKVSQFTPAAREDLSARVISGDLTLISPFTDLGFDPMAEIINLRGEYDLDELTTDAYISQLGRPLFGSRYVVGGNETKQEIIQFAAAKLLNAKFTIKELSKDQILACLSQRLPIEFKSTNYTAQASERKQVEGHMRVCLKVDAAFETMTTTCSSEPLLSEAAYFIMQKPSFNAVAALKFIMEGFTISKGDRGEFLVLLLFTLARDAAVGPADKYGRPVGEKRWFSLSNFICKHVFRAPSTLVNKTWVKALKTLKNLDKDFPDAQLHFNHFVILHEQKAIDITSLLLLMGRGSGILCALNTRGIDSIVTFLKSGTTLSRGNAGLILIQVKNDSNFKDVPQHKLFTAMDPYDLGILEPGDDAVPLIKIVFALAAKTPHLEVVRHGPTKDYNAITYEIWCAGISPDILAPVQNQDVGIWEALLQASHGWKNLYNTPAKLKSIRNLRRSANPGAALNPSHWERWADRGE